MSAQAKAGRADAPFASSISPLATIVRHLKKTQSQELLLRSACLICIYLMAFSIRLVRRREARGAGPGADRLG